MTEFIIVFLALLIVFQNLYWMKVCYDLNHKLMSRNYYEYNQAQALNFPKSEKHQGEVPERDFDAERQAQELNSLMGGF